MTREETIEAIKVMQAYVDGKEIEHRIMHTNNSEWCPIKEPEWVHDLCEYRIKPGQDMVPWDNPSNVPPGCWIRHRMTGPRYVVISVSGTGVAYNLGDVDWAQLHKYWQYSTDCENWFPCTKKEGVIDNV